MFESFSRSWELVKASWQVLRADRELLLFPFLSMIGMIVVTILFFFPLAATGLLEAASEGEELSGGQSLLGFVILFLFYLVAYTVVIFSNTALVGAAMMRLRGEDPTVADGFRIARSRMGRIIEYAAISATIGMILNAIRNQDNFLSQIAASIAEFAWNVVTFLVIPVLVMEDIGAIEAIKRSGSLLKKTWGEQLIANGGIGIVIFLVTLAGIFIVGGPLFLIASAANSGVLMAVAIGAVILVVVFISLIGGALGGIFQAALYKYATEGNAGEFFDESLVAGAFKHK